MKISNEIKSSNSLKNLSSKNTDQNIKTILGIGSPLIDISAQTNIETLTKYGLEFGRTVLADDHKRPFFDVLEKSSDVRYIPGGSVCNSIRVTNWFLKKQPKI